MKFTTIPCDEKLRLFIRNYWLLTAYCTTRGTMQIFSNGAASLHFYLSQPVRIDESERLYSTAFNRHDLGCMVVGVEKGDVIIMGVEFVPFCSRMFFVTDSKVAHFDPSDLNDAEFGELSHRVHGADGTEARTKLLDEFFLKRLSELPPNDVNMERMHDVFDEVVPTDGSEACPPECHEEFSPADLAAIAHIGYKQFSRIFSNTVGLRPKEYLRLVRFHKALMELQKAPSECSITEIAWHCGYYDLSHMTSEFRLICGYSPSELQNSDSGLTEAFQPEFSGLMRKKIKIENVI